ncbi:MAG: DUF1638 domain-containing protein, partial [Candidatus Lokiarchaeota archaeon]|nr:DUF1638 domain-containing protein [Candidatus Lokiarchaeota archaeon]MBD3337508.1 DUF1638 domain-containing protein [Candidatus Lokiarchaeota archaeon]
MEQIVNTIDNQFKIYPLIPPCTFNLKIELIKYYIDKSIIENSITILAYGLCHPEMKKMLKEHGERVIRLKGSNCYEMLLGKEKYEEYHNKAYWMLNKPFLTRFKKDLLAGFELDTINGKMLMAETYKKLLYLEFKEDPLDRSIVGNFAHEVYLDYEIFTVELKHLKGLLKEAIKSSKPTNLNQDRENFMEILKTPELITVLQQIDEIIYKIDVHTRKITYISPQIKNLLGYTPYEFIKIINEEIAIPLYAEEDRNDILATRYKFLLESLEQKLNDTFRAEYRMMHKDNHFIWVEEKLYPIYNKE